jgi:biotin synthase-related radical SAM superfamily protein
MANNLEDVPEQIRVSLGSAIVLGLTEAKLDAAPTTAYLMTYRKEKCTANCGFCPQARTSSARADILSRVSWPNYRTHEVLIGIAKAVKSRRVKRVCIQTLNYPQVFTDLHTIVQAICHSANVPISVSCQPLNRTNMIQLAEAGVERIGIPLDAATEEVFDRTKGVNTGGPYSWKNQWQLLAQASEVFAKARVSTHLIVGLGETEREMVNVIQECVNSAILPALFAFTPIPGTVLAGRTPPKADQYRRVQIARYLIVHGIAKYEGMDFDDKGVLTNLGISKETLSWVIRKGEPFLTSGCPDCNRPFYNEKPSGPIYNFPKKLTSAELSTTKAQLGLG